MLLVSEKRRELEPADRGVAAAARGLRFVEKEGVFESRGGEFSSRFSAPSFYSAKIAGAHALIASRHNWSMYAMRQGLKTQKSESSPWKGNDLSFPSQKSPRASFVQSAAL